MSDLTLSEVSKRYGAVRAVERASMRIAAGSRTVIVGPSGCGKTTLLRLIAGLEAPSEGRITLGATVLSDASGTMPVHRRNVGYVTQDGALFPHLSVAANIAFGLTRRASDRDGRVKELMTAVGLPPSMADRRPDQLSGGQQQRVALARALARRPALMLLDEPFSSLDAGLRESMREMVGDVLGATGVTSVLVTHDQAEALSFADHLAVMRDGRLIQDGPPAELYWRPVDPETALFLGEAIILDAEITQGTALCALGRIPVDRSGSNGKGRIMLRPEQLRMLPVGDAGDPALGSAPRARIRSQSFRGPTARTVIQLLDGSQKIVLSEPTLLLPPVGSVVALVTTGAAHVFG